MRRWMIFIIGIPIYTFLLMVLGSGVIGALLVENWTDEGGKEFLEYLSGMFKEGEWWIDAGFVAICAVVIQAIFLIPVMRKQPSKAPQSRSLKVSIIIAAAVASSLTLGLFFAFEEFSRTVLETSFDIQDQTGGVLPLMIIFGTWIFWSAVLLIFCKGIWADRLLGRLVGLLIAGTLLEFLIVLPLDIMVRRRSDCYCLSGTMFALCIAIMGTL